MTRRLAHIGIATRNLEQSIRLFCRLFQTAEEHVEEITDQKVRAVSLHVGDTHLELLEPTHQDSPIARFLERRGEGIHHLSFEVDDIEAEIARLQSEGFQMVDQQARIGAGGCRIAFLHPTSTNGVLIEISQRIV